MNASFLLPSLKKGPFIIAYVTFIIFGLQAEAAKKNDLHLIQNNGAQTISIILKVVIGRKNPWKF